MLPSIPSGSPPMTAPRLLLALNLIIILAIIKRIRIVLFPKCDSAKCRIGLVIKHHPIGASTVRLHDTYHFPNQAILISQLQEDSAYHSAMRTDACRLSNAISQQTRTCCCCDCLLLEPLAYKYSMFAQVDMKTAETKALITLSPPPPPDWYSQTSIPCRHQSSTTATTPRCRNHSKTSS